MSYDLMVFEGKAAPVTKLAFEDWYSQQTEWAEDHDYNTPEVSTFGLQAWFHQMRSNFPPLNGPYATDDVDALEVTDYSIGKSVIYAAFALTISDKAREVGLRVAKECGVGFYDLSGSDEVIWPNGTINFESKRHALARFKRRQWWQYWM